MPTRLSSTAPLLTCLYSFFNVSHPNRRIAPKSNKWKRAIQQERSPPVVLFLLLLSFVYGWLVLGLW